jgi:hypothetical protein
MRETMVRSSLLGFALVAGLGLPAASVGAGDAIGLAVAGRAGTPGFGLDVSKSLTSSVNLRGTLSLFSYGHDFDANLSQGNVGADVHFEGKLRLKTLGLLADLYPTGDGFHLTGGLIYNRNRVVIDATPTVSVTINDQTYPVGEVGTLTGTAEIGSRWVPYAGLGFGNPTGHDHRVTVLLDLGVIFQGQPRLSLSASGAAAGVPGLQSDLDVAADKVNREHLDKGYLKYYPVLSLGIAVRLF